MPAFARRAEILVKLKQKKSTRRGVPGREESGWRDTSLTTSPLRRLKYAILLTRRVNVLRGRRLPRSTRIFNYNFKSPRNKSGRRRAFQPFSYTFILCRSFRCNLKIFLQIEAYSSRVTCGAVSSGSSVVFTLYTGLVAP